jgi:DNA-binding winged helix-turn-helix (wHTH) protein
MTSGSAGQQGTSGAFRLGEWLVEPTLNRLSCDGRSEHVEPKAVEVLVCLAERAGEVVTRREIVDRVWATEFIADNTLTHAVTVLRGVLGDGARTPRFIETIPKRGYRLVEKVEWVDRPAPAAAGDRSGPHPPVARINADGVVTHLGAPPPRPLCSLFSLSDEILLEAGDYVLGRCADASILVVSARTSRCHSRLVVGESRAVLEDTGSKNGTLVNGRPVDGPTELADGDRIDVGSVELLFRAPLALTTQTRSQVMGPAGDATED